MRQQQRLGLANRPDTGHGGKGMGHGFGAMSELLLRVGQWLWGIEFNYGHFFIGLSTISQFKPH